MAEDCWEARMARRAAERLAVEHAREQVAAELARLAEEQRLREESRAEYEAGPPDGCAACWIWNHSVFPPYTWSWGHRLVDAAGYPADVLCDLDVRVCRHGCHGEPYDLGPLIAIG